jgi:DNA processing protein
MMAMQNAAELGCWMRLDRISGIGPERTRRLLSTFGMPENIFQADYAALRAIVPERVVQAILAPVTEETQAAIDRTLTWLDRPDNFMLTLGDDTYPGALLNIPDPPVILYGKGRRELLSRPSLAVVGSRNGTVQGVSHAEKFSEALSRAGWTIVSGLALGIDTAAHEGGLRGGASTIAVIGTGADIVYPARNHRLAHRIAAEGCLISEYPLGTPAIASNFPRRNRIISGLAGGVLVVEAAAQSGSLITARMAGEQGRDVFAIPGSIHSPLSKGCHQLIRQGAKLVESAQDILDELPPTGSSFSKGMAPAAPPGSDEAADDAILKAIGFDPVDTDTIAMRSNHDAASVASALLTLELAGRIEMLQGGHYRRLA